MFAFLLPLREKVSAKLTDEGFLDEHRSVRRDPSPDPCGATLSRKGRGAAPYFGSAARSAPVLASMSSVMAPWLMGWTSFRLMPLNWS